jgi:hypothetical protein
MWDNNPTCENGPHCAIGRILYANGEQGVIAYFGRCVEHWRLRRFAETLRPVAAKGPQWVETKH